MIAAAKTASRDCIGCELAADVLRTYGTLRLRVNGWSMFPAVWPGDTLTIERTTIGDISKGDIVLFQRSRRLFAHRVVRKAKTGTGLALLTCGDTMSTPDELVSTSELLGRVITVVRKGKSIAVGKNPRLLDRAVSTLIQHSEIASRVVKGVHSFRTASQVHKNVEVG